MRCFLAYVGKTLSRILIKIPESWRWFFCSFIAIVIYDGLRFRRRVILQNLKIVFPDRSLKEYHRIARSSIKNILYSFYEFCLLPSIDEAWIQAHVDFKGLNHLDQAMKKDKGVLLLSLHLGHGDMAISMIAHRGYPLSVISKHFKVKWLNDFWFGTRTRFGAHFLDPHGRNSSFDILKILKQKRLLIFVLDQYMGPPYGLETTFFGVKTGTAYGLSLFALKTGAPVLPVWTYRDALGRNVIELGEEIAIEQKSSKEGTLLATTQKYNHVLEELILQHPEDWLWIHRRWKKYLSDE